MVRNGSRVSYYENGNIKNIRSFQRCYQTGYEYRFYPNGTLKDITQYNRQHLNVGKEGYWIYFNEDGSVQKQMKYENDHLLFEQDFSK